MTEKTILIIDDSEADQILCSHKIREVDSSIKIYDSYGAYQGLEVLSKRKNIDVILLDINMPDMDGFEFLDTYEKIYGKNAHQVYLFLGSSLSTEMEEQAATYECRNGLILKPLRKQNVIDMFEAKP